LSLYVDTSALLKLYVEEPDSVACEALLATDEDWVTARHTLVEAPQPAASGEPLQAVSSKPYRTRGDLRPAQCPSTATTPP